MIGWLVELIAWISAEILGQEAGNQIDKIKVRKWIKILISLILVIAIVTIILIFFRA